VKTVVIRRKLTSSIWTYALILGIVYYVYQSSFGYTAVKGKEAMDPNQVVFVTIEEQRYGVQKAGFDSLYKELEVWKYHKKSGEVDLKFKANQPQPGDRTKVMLIYDRGFDSFQRFAQVTPITSFPYQYDYEEKPFVNIESYNDSGTIYIDYRGKKIKLESGKTYYAWNIKDRTLVKTVLTNHGIMDKAKFKVKDLTKKE
jgi:hypothetical protein